ncbi:uncharacterized protein G2W53_012119 [Senna tora]|uniref:Uncharacterized protein n=1 Tax=Senna tora TaxID=362788 RepID=A0A834U084_9FABA|nr:uncharacterized protein G2W53_012119 [Senna tora]
MLRYEDHNILLQIFQDSVRATMEAKTKRGIIVIFRALYFVPLPLAPQDRAVRAL